MKKLNIFLLTLLSSGAAYALPLGNPSSPDLFTQECKNFNEIFCGCNFENWCDAWDFRVGFYGDYVFNRHLKVETGKGDLEFASIDTNAGYLSLVLFDRLEVFTTLGASNISLQQDDLIFDVTINTAALVFSESELFFDTSFSWSIGARAVLWSIGCLDLGLEGQYFRTTPRLDHFVDYASGAKTYFNDVDSAYHEWQVGLGVSYRVFTQCPSFSFIPYMGVKWSRAILDVDPVSFLPNPANPGVIITLVDMESHKRWGYVIGTTLAAFDRLAVTVEGRFGDEKAVYVNAETRF